MVNRDAFEQHAGDRFAALLAGKRGGVDQDASAGDLFVADADEQARAFDVDAGVDELDGDRGGYQGRW